MVDLFEIQSAEGGWMCEGWSSLKCFTPARIALGRIGTSVPLKEMFDLRLAHSTARDAIYSLMDLGKLSLEMQQFKLPVLHINSRALNRQEYLQRPDLGRQPDDESLQQLKHLSSASYDIAIIIGDGLSAKAINEHAVNLLQLLIPTLRSEDFVLAPITVVKNARVALSDEVGETLQTKLTVMLIGERPGLSSSDSLGVYLTFSPKKGLTDESRNCISNIRNQGLSYQLAAEKLMYFIREALARKVSGVKLKEIVAVSD